MCHEVFAPAGPPAPTLPTLVLRLKKKGREGNTHKALLMNNVINYPFRL